MCFRKMPSNQGFTLLEILVTIVVLAIAATTIMGVFISTTSQSASPVIQQQAIAIAEAYMEEIRLQQFADPTDPETGGAEEGSRANYDDIQDYNGTVNGAVSDQNGVAIPELSGYSITVSVTGTAFSGISSANAMLIDIAVDHAAIDPIQLSSFRVNY